LIVTSTSAHDKKVLDIMRVKPGCVICDVSRPLDIREEDALKRPDVLVIESGEIQLPGDDIQISCDMGTPDNVVYACLAETALLALEGRMESFTLSRHISYDRVREIYDIAKKHGAKLAAIRGHSGLISDSEIDLCREHATEALKTWRKT
jgi:predicted amino acid dehydrogenase